MGKGRRRDLESPLGISYREGMSAGAAFPETRNIGFGGKAAGSVKRVWCFRSVSSGRCPSQSWVCLDLSMS